MSLVKFQKEMKKEGIGLSLFFNVDGDNIDPNIIYFSQYTGFGILAITQKKALLFVPRAENDRAKKTSKVRVVVAEKKMLKTLKQRIKKVNGKIGIDKNRVTLNFYKILRKEIRGRYLDVSPMCQNLRAIKTDNEISLMREACRIADEIMHKTFWSFKKFKTEAEVAAFMINEAGKKGAGVAFKPIIASGRNACEAHHFPTNEKIKKGFCVIDFGVRYKGYCSDMTRTIYFGEPSKEEVEIYYSVLDIQQKLINECRPGASFVRINMKAHELFGKKSRYFTHLIGHGLGVEVHENPNPKKTGRRTLIRLAENSVVTIEPGLYYPNKLGIRIEDDILIGSKGPEVLTKTGKNLLIISKRHK
jgi:Xaa-Pro aminopeptidase